MLINHIVSIFYIVPDEITNYHNKMRIMHWDLEINTKRKHIYITQYSVEFGPIDISYSEKCLKQEKLISSSDYSLSINGFCESRIYFIAEVCTKHIKIAYFRTLSEDEGFEELTLENSNIHTYFSSYTIAQLDNHSKIGAISKSLHTAGVSKFITFELMKDKMGIQMLTYNLHLPLNQ